MDRRSRAGTPIDSSSLLGTWLNSNRNSTGITEFSVSSDKRQLTIGVVEAGNSSNPPARVVIERIYAGGPVSNIAAGFIAELESSERRSRLQVNVKLGVAVLGAFHSYAGESGPGNRFSREFFFRAP